MDDLSVGFTANCHDLACWVASFQDFAHKTGHTMNDIVIADGAYRDAQNQTGAPHIIPYRKPRNGTLTTQEQAYNILDTFILCLLL